MKYDRRIVYRRIGCLLLMLLFGINQVYAAPVPITVHKRNPAKSTRARNPLLRKIPGTSKGYHFSLSAQPSDEEISKVRLFEERLAPVNSKQNDKENRELAQALIAFHSRKSRDDLTTLESFLASHPDSRWKGALELNLGLLYRDQGHLTKARQFWKSCWANLKDSKVLEPKILADRAIGEMLLQNARLGKMDLVEAELSEISGRQLYGSTEDRVEGARQGLARLKSTQPVYRCGPLALSTIYGIATGTHAPKQTLENCRASANGVSLAQLVTLSDQLKMNFQAAKRQQGAQIITPAVMHWKAHHFSALLGKSADRYFLQDGTFGSDSDLTMTPSAVEAESDGYFLVPAGPLPEGWSKVSIEEASKVFGRLGAQDRYNKPKTKWAPKCPLCDFFGMPGGMARASAFSLQASVNVEDAPLSYSVGVGPEMAFSVNYNDGETDMPGIWGFTSFGPNWTFNWVSWLWVDANTGNVDIHVPGGGVESFINAHKDSNGNPVPSDPIFTPDYQSLAQLDRILRPDGTGYYYKRRMPDGSAQIYDLADNNTSRIELLVTQVLDPQQNAAILTYDNDFRLTTITDASGRQSSINYLGTIGNDKYYVQSITDPFGRSCSFAYDADRRLSKITDVIGLESSFTYTNENSMRAMTTPYGTTAFQRGPIPYTTGGTYGFVGDCLRTQYPDGTASLVINYMYGPVRTAFWNREALQRYPNDFNDPDEESRWHHCELTHWLTDPDRDNILTPFFDWTKKPLEEKIFYNYGPAQNPQTPGQIDMKQHPIRQPVHVSRAINAGAQTQDYYFEYNADGFTTKSIDPLGRTFSFDYRAPGSSDLLAIRETKGIVPPLQGRILGQWEYTTQSAEHHVPTKFRDASGYETSYTYNAKFQPETITDAAGNPTTLSYTDDLLTSINGPLPGNADVTAISYDDKNRVSSITNSLGYSNAFAYDAMDRLLKVTYPDNTTEEVNYGDRLDPVFFKDRIGRVTQRSYDSLGQLAFEVDPLGRKTSYEWCACGALHSLTDPAGNITTWLRDIQGRVTEKQYADGSSCQFSYDAYRNLLASRTDARNQTATYAYNIDDTVSGITYTNSPSTSNVTLMYDANVSRLSTITNGWGTISYSYNSYRDVGAPPNVGAGRLASITNNVIANSEITFAYDSLGRTTNRSVHGTDNSTTWAFDQASRIITETSPVGTFSFDYLGDTVSVKIGSLLLSKVTYPSGQSANYDYFNNVGDFRLKQIQNLSSGSVLLSQFDYAYNPAGEIIQWRRQQAQNNIHQNFEYDKAGQVISAQSGGSSQPPYSFQEYYTYDKASNRTSVSTVSASGTHSIQQTVHNKLNEMIVSVPGGPARYKAMTSKAIKAAEVSSPVITTRSVQNGTTFSVSRTPPNSNTTVSVAQLGNDAAVTIGGAVQSGTVVSLTVANAALGVSPITVNYTVKDEDALDSIATGLSAAVKNNCTLKDFGVSASNTYAADFRFAKEFTANAVLSTADSGNNKTAVSAIDGADNPQTDLYNVPIQGGAGTEYTYDANGNLTSDGTNSFEWDAEDRLTRIIYGDPADGNRSDFTYDALGRCVRITELGAILDSKDFVWSGVKRCEQRSTLHKKFYARAESIDGTAYDFMLDHLGSVREVASAGGTIESQYSYSPFGERTKIAGTGPDADFGFAGLYHHDRSGLDLAMFRPYSSSLGRWLSRDPLGEAAGTNLYVYALNSPARYKDPLGLDAYVLTDPVGAFGLHFGHEAILIGNDQTGYMFYSKAMRGFGNRTELPFQTIQDAAQALPRYTEYSYFRTTPDQDLAMLLEASETLHNRYDPFRNNCVGFDLNVLQAGGVPAPHQDNFNMPNPTFNGLRPPVSQSSGVWPPAPEPDMVP